MSNLNNDGYEVREVRTAAPVAEAVVEQPSFWSRFWWLLPLLALLIALPFILRGCRHETPVAEVPVVPPPATEAPTTPVPVETLPAHIDRCEGLSGTLNFRWWGSPDREALQNEAIEAFREKNPDVTFNVMPVGFSGFQDQLGVEGAAQTLPDVFTSNVEWIAGLAGDGLLLPLTNSQYIDLAPIQDSLSEVTVDGNVYAVPTGLNAASLLVNLDILEEAGIPVPDDSTWTWDDFARIAQQVSDAGLTNHNGESVFGAAHLGGQQVARVWANQTDGGMFNAAGQLNWSEESIVNYLNFVRELEQNGATPPAALQSEVGTLSPNESLMALGRAAFQPQWSNQLNAVATAAGGANIGLLRFPGDATSTHVGTWLRPSMTFAIAANTPYPEAAECFVNFMVNSPEATEIMGIDRGIPMNQAIFNQIVPGLTGPNAQQAEFIDRIAANPGASVPVPQLGGDLNAIILTPTDAALFGQQTPQQAAQSMRTELQNALN